jgi:hypothetical protein
MNELTSEWVKKADNDFHSADLLLTAGEFPIPDAACYTVSSARKNISKPSYRNTWFVLNARIV